MVYRVEERVGLHSRGKRGFTQSMNARGNTVEERQDLHSRGTPVFTQSRNARVYTVE